jgi:hypothetical protein
VKIELTNIKWNATAMDYYYHKGKRLPRRIRIELDQCELEDNASEPLKDLIDSQVEEYCYERWRTCGIVKYSWHFV